MDRIEKILVILVCLDLAFLTYFLTSSIEMSVYGQTIQVVFGFFGIYLAVYQFWRSK